MAIRSAAPAVLAALVTLLSFTHAAKVHAQDTAAAPDAGVASSPGELPPSTSSGELQPTAPPPAGSATVPPPPSGQAIPEPPSAPPSAPRQYATPGARYPTVPDGEASALESAETRSLRIPSRVATRLRVLDRDFTALGARGGNGIVDGVLAIVSGGLSITIGLLVGDSSRNLSNFLFIIGGAAVARGVIDLALTPDPSDAAIEFGHMPMGTVDEVKLRLRYGETALEDLADETRLARLLDAGVSIGAGVGFSTLFLVQNDLDAVEPLDWFLLIGAAISVVSGVINLVSRSEAERRWDAYSELRDRLRRERHEERASRLEAHVGATLIPGGAAVGVHGSF